MAPPAKSTVNPKIDHGKLQYLLGATESLAQRLQKMKTSSQYEMSNDEDGMFYVIREMAQILLDLIGNDPKTLLLRNRLGLIADFQTKQQIARDKRMLEPHY
jgi:hypothetical protein